MVAAVLDRVRTRFHEARADAFVQLMRPWQGARLLDLGGGDGSLAERIAQRVPMRVVVADAATDAREAATGRGFEHVLLDPGAPLPFGVGDFDFLLCNSVIEHVTLPKSECVVNSPVPQKDWKGRSRDAQKAFAAQIRQMGVAYFVQTPHRHFPIETHTHLPFVQYLSHNHLCALVKVTDRVWIKQCNGVVDWELLTPAQMRKLFPEAIITVERALGLPKSVIAWHRPGRS